MPWAALPDDLHVDPQAFGAGGEALGLFSMVRSWLSQSLTDGFVPRQTAMGYARALGLQDPEGEKGALGRLVATGLWAPVGTDFRDANYLENNPSKERVVAKKALTKKRQADWRAKNTNGGEKTYNNASSSDINASLTRESHVNNGAAPAPSLSPSGREISHTSGVPAGAGAYVPARPRVPADPLAVELLAELKRHAALADVATPDVAEKLAGNAQLAGKRPADVVRAIGEAAREAGSQAAIGQPLTENRLSSTLFRYAAKARPDPSPSTTNGHRGPGRGASTPWIDPTPPVYRAPPRKDP